MTKLMDPYTDGHGTTWYPVSHAMGAIVYSLTPESQKLWQEYADKQKKELIQLMQRRKGT